MVDARFNMHRVVSCGDAVGARGTNLAGPRLREMSPKLRKAQMPNWPVHSAFRWPSLPQQQKVANTKPNSANVGLGGVIQLDFSSLDTVFTILEHSYTAPTAQPTCLTIQLICQWLPTWIVDLQSHFCIFRPSSSCRGRTRTSSKSLNRAFPQPGWVSSITNFPQTCRVSEELLQISRSRLSHWPFGQSVPNCRLLKERSDRQPNAPSTNVLLWCDRRTSF